MRSWTLVMLVSASSVLSGVLGGCGMQPQDQRAELERLGYSNVAAVKDASLPTYSATVNDCTVHLFKSKDKEVWNVSIQTTANGKTLKEQQYMPGEGVYEAVANAAALQVNREFIAICP